MAPGHAVRSGEALGSKTGRFPGVACMILPRVTPFIPPSPLKERGFLVYHNHYSTSVLVSVTESTIDTPGGVRYTGVVTWYTG